MKYDEKVRDVMSVIDSGSTEEEIRAEALRVKQSLSEDAQAMFLAITAIDSLIDVFAPAPQSLYNRGWLPVPIPGADTVIPAPGGQPLSARRRSEKIIEAARQLAHQKDGRVTGREVAEQVAREERRSNTRAFGISVSNVLARAAEFETVAPGEYRLRTNS